MAMSPEKFRDLFASLTAGTAEDAQNILNCADILKLTEDQRSDVHTLKLAHQKTELRKQRR